MNPGWIDDGNDEDDEDEAELGFCDTLDEGNCAENALEVPDRVERVWSILRRDWSTDCLSNLSRTDMVLTTSSKKWGSALMMAMTTSSS